MAETTRDVEGLIEMLESDGECHHACAGDAGDGFCICGAAKMRRAAAEIRRLRSDLEHFGWACRTEPEEAE